MHLSVVNMKEENMLEDSNNWIKCNCAMEAQTMFTHIVCQNAEARGMRVNDSKTELLCES